MPESISRMLYVDDSGHPQNGLVVYGWVEFSPDHWARVLRTWLDLRKMLWREFSVPIVRELHATEFVNGRGRISKRVPERHVHEGVEYWKDFGREVAEKCLEAIRSTEGLSVGSVWRRGEPSELGRTRQEAYAALIGRLEHELQSQSSFGMVFMDGDGSDSSYRSTHRQLRLANRRVIEDAIHLDSRASQLVQMADLVAWAANVAVDRHPGQEFAWNWYQTYLAERDPRRTPQEI